MNNPIRSELKCFIIQNNKNVDIICIFKNYKCLNTVCATLYVKTGQIGSPEKTSL